MSKAKTTRRKSAATTDATSQTDTRDDFDPHATRTTHTGQCRLLRSARVVCVLPCGGYGWVELHKGAVYPFDQLKVRAKGAGESGDGMADGYVVRVLGGGRVCVGRRWFEEWCEEVEGV